MSTKQLEKLRAANDAYLARWKGGGRKTTQWKCQHCHASNEHAQPRKGDLGPGRDCWSSMMVCVHCGELNFVKIFPDGYTELVALSDL